MSVLPIRLYGDPVLREKARPVSQVDESLRELIAAMGETMYGASGVGLAANQVGETRRVLVVDYDQVEDRRTRRKNPLKRHLRAYINAEIVETSLDDEAGNEGCLSIPGLEADVFRPRRVKVRYMDESGATHEEWYEGYAARVLQHEIDHLDGILYTDRIDAASRAKMVAALGRIRRGDVETKYPVRKPDADGGAPA